METTANAPAAPTPVELAQGILLGGDTPVLIAGPCVIESTEGALAIAARLQEQAAQAGLPLIFKASFDKANRTSLGSFRGIGRAEALDALRRVREELGLPVLTDVHQPDQVEQVAAVVDVLQVPAFLCRQTDLLLAVGRSGCAVNLKKGQFMAPADMAHALEKVRQAGGRAFLTERGTSFGYHDLVVDMRSLPLMRRLAPVVFDVTHSLQRPGGGGDHSDGYRELAAPLARGAAAVGVDGFFIETHPEPQRALSDAATMLPLEALPALLTSLKQIWQVSRDQH